LIVFNPVSAALPRSEVAAGFGVSERTARKWLARYRKEGATGLENRSSRPRSVANRTLDPWIDLMERPRRAYRLTAEEIAAKLHLARSTVAAWLKRRGLGRLKKRCSAIDSGYRADGLRSLEFTHSGKRMALVTPSS
jgi:transposase